ncbi:MAG TPA: histidine kinase [Actinomycetota bacterium]|nr:histidine kinase [Actinomycetota bacterium]
MTQRVARIFSLTILILCTASVVTAGVVFLSNRGEVPPNEIVVVGDPSAPRMQEVLGELEQAVVDGDNLDSTDGNFWPLTVLIVLFLLLWLGTGVLIVWRRPSNWAGWLFLITGAAFPLATLTQAVMIYGLKVEPGSVPLIGVWATLGEYALFPLALTPLLFLLYPDGRLPSRRWRWAVVALVGGTTLAFLGFVLRPGPLNAWIQEGILYENPLAIGWYTWGGTVITIGTILALAATISTPVAVVRRFRRSSGEERQQMRVLAFVAAIVGVFFGLFILMIVIGGLFGLEDGPDDAGDWVFGLVLGLTAFTVVVGVPVSYLVAIFRYRLWDLDVVIKKAVVAIALTLLMTGVGLAILGIASRFFVADENPFVVLVGGIILGLLSIPMVRLSRRIANRIAFGKRSTPYEVLTAFGERVGGTYSTEDVLPRMAQLLVEGTGATSARVLVRVGSDLIEEARWPEAATRGEEDVVPVIDQGQELGALAVAMPASDPMNPSKQKLIRDLASQAGLVLRNVKLIEELRASRGRLVAAQDEERRKIERNLHDGAQQQLVALTVQLKLARGLVQRDPTKAGAMLDTIQGSATDALEDLRDLARGIYPPLLADQGLPAALEAQARKAAVPTTVEADEVGRYAQEVEAAVYFCALEALNNVAKYSGATHATVKLAQQNGRLTFSVEDDGRGFDPNATERGTGLQGMADRLEAIGGELTIQTALGGGTSVRGRIPKSGRRA